MRSAPRPTLASVPVCAPPTETTPPCPPRHRCPTARSVLDLLSYGEVPLRAATAALALRGKQKRVKPLRDGRFDRAREALRGSSWSFAASRRAYDAVLR